MHIFGLDFTSAPGTRKPITCAGGVFADGGLRLDSLARFTDFMQFEAFLAHEGAWVAGFDFPFGQPAALIDALGWGATWAEYVRQVGAMPLEAFAAALYADAGQRPKGKRYLKRTGDSLAGAISPMMLHYVPVARMFYQGAPRLLAAGVCVLPCHPNDDSRIALEVYPKLVARRFTDAPYKHDVRAKQTEARRAARVVILDGLQAQCEALYGFRCAIDAELAAALVADPTGDSLDAALCTVQAAWAYTQRDPHYGIPAHADPREGWIVDPALAIPHKAGYKPPL